MTGDGKQQEARDLRAVKAENAWLSELIDCDGDRNKLRSVLRAFSANLRQQPSQASQPSTHRTQFLNIVIAETGVISKDGNIATCVDRIMYAFDKLQPSHASGEPHAETWKRRCEKAADKIIELNLKLESEFQQTNTINLLTYLNALALRLKSLGINDPWYVAGNAISILQELCPPRALAKVEPRPAATIVGPDGAGNATGANARATGPLQDYVQVGYGYRYADGIHFDTGGREINGGRPLESFPVFRSQPRKI